VAWRRSGGAAPLRWGASATGYFYSVFIRRKTAENAFHSLKLPTYEWKQREETLKIICFVRFKMSMPPLTANTVFLILFFIQAITI